MHLYNQFLTVGLETKNAATIRLHDKGTAVRLAVLELVRHLLLEVNNLVKSFLLQIPYIQDAGMLLCP